MGRDKVLPPKLSTQLIKSYLDINTFSPYSSEQHLCDYVNEGDFKLHFQTLQFHAYQTSDAVVTNDTIQIVVNSTPLQSITTDTIVATINFTGTPSIFDDNRRKPYSVTTIRDQGIEYYITEPGSLIVGVDFDEADFYSDRDEIVSYRKNNIYKDTLDKNMLGEQVLDDRPLISHDDNPQYSDPESEYYAEELHIAVQAHEAIVIGKYGNQNLNRENRVQAWADEQKSDLNLSQASIDRISTLIGPKRIKRK